MTFMTQTPKQNAVADFEAALERATRERAQIIDRLANPRRGRPTPDPGALSRANERIEVAAAKLEAAQAAASRENRALPNEENVRTIIAEISPKLDQSLEDIAEASAAVISAANLLRVRIATRNKIITQARNDLRSAALPATGSEIDGTELGYAEDRVQIMRQSQKTTSAASLEP